MMRRRIRRNGWLGIFHPSSINVNEMSIPASVPRNLEFPQHWFPFVESLMDPSAWITAGCLPSWNLLQRYAHHSSGYRLSKYHERSFC